MSLLLSIIHLPTSGGLSAVYGPGGPGVCICYVWLEHNQGGNSLSCGCWAASFAVCCPAGMEAVLVTPWLPATVAVLNPGKAFTCNAVFMPGCVTVFMCWWTICSCMCGAVPAAAEVGALHCGWSFFLATLGVTFFLPPASCSVLAPRPQRFFSTF